MHHSTGRGPHLIGKTATPERLDGKGLGVEAGSYFEALVLGPSAAWLVEQGWLARSQEQQTDPPDG